MPFDAIDYGFTENDEYGQTLRLAVTVFETMGDRAVSEQAYKRSCNDYINAYHACFVTSHVINDNAEVMDGGAWQPFDTYRENHPDTELGDHFKLYFAKYLQNKFRLAIVAHHSGDYFSDSSSDADDNWSDTGVCEDEEGISAFSACPKIEIKSRKRFEEKETPVPKVQYNNFMVANEKSHKQSPVYVKKPDSKAVDLGFHSISMENK